MFWGTGMDCASVCLLVSLVVTLLGKSLAASHQGQHVTWGSLVIVCHGVETNINPPSCAWANMSSHVNYCLCPCQGRPSALAFVSSKPWCSQVLTLPLNQTWYNKWKPMIVHDRGFPWICVCVCFKLWNHQQVFNQIVKLMKTVEPKVHNMICD